MGDGKVTHKKEEYIIGMKIRNIYNVFYIRLKHKKTHISRIATEEKEKILLFETRATTISICM